MKNHSFVSLVAIVLVFLVQAQISYAKEIPKKLEKLETQSGEIYKNVTIRSVTPAGIKVFHSQGAAMIPFEELSEDTQEMFGGFDAKAAAEYRLKENKKQAVIRRTTNKAYSKHLAESKKKADAKRIQKEKEDKMKALKAKQEVFTVEVVRVLPQGVLADILVSRTIGTGSARIGGGGGGVKVFVKRTGKVIFIEGLKGMAEKQRVSISAAPNGNFTYEDKDEESRTVEKWFLLKMKK